MTDFELTQIDRIDLRAAIAQREIKILAKRANEEISRLASHHIRSMGQSRRFWNERNKKGVSI
jgi:hypothetical protein